MNTVGNIATLFCQWLIVMLLPRMGGFDETGVFSLAISISSIFNIIATFNMRSYQVADGYVLETEGGYLSSRLLTVGISFLACFCYLGTAGYSYVQSLAIVAYLLYKNLLSLADVYVGTLQIKNRLDLAGLGALGEGIISAAVFFVTYCETKNLLFSVTLMALSGGLFYIVFTISCRRVITGCSFEPPQPLKSSIAILKKCFPLFLAAAFPTILNALPKIILQNHGGDETVGIFSSLSAPTIVIMTVATGLFAPLITSFSALSKSGDYRKFKSRFSYLLVVLLISGVACLGVSILCGSWFFGWLYGEEILVHIEVFYNLVCAIVFCATATYSATALVTLDKLPFVAAASFFGLVVGSVACFLFIPTLIMMGAAWGLIAAYLSQTIMQLVGVYVFTEGDKGNGQ